MLVSKTGFLSSENFSFNPLDQDLGFAKMLSMATHFHESAQVSESGSDDGFSLTHLEQLFLSQWKVVGYDDLFTQTEQVFEKTEAAFARYQERLEQVEATFLQYEINRFVTLGMNSGGLFTHLSENANFSDSYFLNVWNTERSIFGWEQQNQRLLDSVATLGIAKKLAQATSDHSLSRQQAALSGQLMPFISDILNQSFNSDLDGVMRNWQWDIPTSLALGAGETPTEVFNSEDATAQQLRSFGRYLFLENELTTEEYSLVQHVEQLTGDVEDDQILADDILEDQASSNWLARIEQIKTNAEPESLVAYWAQSLLDKLSAYKS